MNVFRRVNKITNLFRRPYCISNFSIHESKDVGTKEKSTCFQSTIKPRNDTLRERLYRFGLYVAACLPKYVQEIRVENTDELEILTPPEGCHQVLDFLKNNQNCCFTSLMTVTAIDVPSREYRFEIIYCLLSMRYNSRALVKTYTDELSPIKSCYDIWKSANWPEREVYDLFGVIFTGHPDLRRIMTDYGFQGHPLRKDFPIVGYVELRYDDTSKRIVYEPSEFNQECRPYDLKSPWRHDASTCNVKF